jgi:sugar phosphate isomerase/epimerase
MRLAISNIAWRPEECGAILPILVETGVTGLEIAPGLTFYSALDSLQPDAHMVAAFQREIAQHGLRVVSMQSLLFGRPAAGLFGDAPARSAFEDGLTCAIALSERLEVPNLVVGSPRNRVIPPELDPAAARETACGVFRRLGDKARAAGTKLALEANPTAYGANFLTTLQETTAFAAVVDHPCVTVNFDLGALHVTGEIERAEELYEGCAERVSHVHISEPHLRPAPQDPEQFGNLARALLARGYEGWFSIEMRQAEGHNSYAVRASLEACVRQLRIAVP